VNRRLLSLILVLAALVTTGGTCTAKVENPPAVQFAPRDLAYVEQAIAQAMLKLQWLAQKERPGSILGTLNVRDRQAVIRITFTPSSYRITYVSSRNLDYSRRPGGAQEIHSNYNGWVNKLMKDIDVMLASGPVGSYVGAKIIQ
jgi:hypothetical protein